MVGRRIFCSANSQNKWVYAVGGWRRQQHPLLSGNFVFSVSIKTRATLAVPAAVWAYDGIVLARCIFPH